jgi:hypothetical protein
MKQNQSSNQNPGCLVFLSNLFGGDRNRQKAPDGVAIGDGKEGANGMDTMEADPFPYRLRDDFLSPAEKSFYQVIKGLMGNYFTICPKVSLADIFFVTRPNENKSAYNRINRKHVDFLICSTQTLEPVFAIELDDSSHERADRVERDTFVDRVFEAAQLPLLHIPVQRSYNTNDLGVLFKKALQAKNIPNPNAANNEAPLQPAMHLQSQPGKDPRDSAVTETMAALCPKCGSPMALRTAKNGAEAGRKFYGCTNYPKCRMTLPLESGA